MAKALAQGLGSKVKNALKYDDTLDVFGVHCIGGIIGALGTAVVAAPSLGGQGYFDYTVGGPAFKLWLDREKPITKEKSAYDAGIDRTFTRYTPGTTITVGFSFDISTK